VAPKRFSVPLVWLALVLFLGTAWFGVDQTSAVVLPALRKLSPSAGMATLRAIHLVLRKLSHLAEYAVLALLWFRAVGRRATPRSAAWVALLVSIACAFVDEAHQAMLLTRSGSARDVVIDSLGALVTLIVARGRVNAQDPAAICRTSRGPAGSSDHPGVASL